MSQLIRDAWLVAAYELAEVIRSKRLWVLMLLYVGGAVLGASLFIEALQSIEDTLAALGPEGQQGASVGLLATPQAQELLSWYVGDPAVAARLAVLPPLALFYGWMALSFIPVLATVTGAEAVSADLASGAVRYVLLRIPPLHYSAGKLLGQYLLLLWGILVGAAGVWLTGSMSMADFAPFDSAMWLVRLGLRASVYGFAFLGLALGVSHMCRSRSFARAYAFLALFTVSSLTWLTEWEPVRQRVWLRQFTEGVLPSSYRLDLWNPELSQRLPALLGLLVLGLGYCGLGYLYRVRRDW